MMTVPGIYNQLIKYIVLSAFCFGITISTAYPAATFGKYGYPNESGDPNFINFKRNSLDTKGAKGDCAVWLTNDTEEEITLTKIVNTDCNGTCRVVDKGNWRPCKELSTYTNRAYTGKCVLKPGEAKWVFYIEEIDGDKPASLENSYFHFYIKIGNSPAIEAFTMNYEYGWAAKDDIVENKHRITVVGGQYTTEPVSGNKTVNGKTYTFSAIRGDYSPDLSELTFLGIHTPLSSRKAPPSTADDVDKLNVMTFNLANCVAEYLWVRGQRLDVLSANAKDYFKNVDLLIFTEAMIDVIGTTDPEELVQELLCCGPDKPFQKHSTILNGWPAWNHSGDNGGVVILSKDEGLVVEQDPELYIKKSDYEKNRPYPTDKELHYWYGGDECPDSYGGRCNKNYVHLGAIDAYPDKGFLKVKYTKKVNGKFRDYYIIASHTTPEAKFRVRRENQLKAMRRMADDLPKDARIIYVGDFNTEANEIDAMLGILGADSDYREYEGYTSNANNFYHLSQSGYKPNLRLDWVLPHKNNAAQPLMNARTVTMRHPTLPSFDLSDHHALLAVLDYGTTSSSRYGQYSRKSFSNDVICHFSRETGVIKLSINKQISDDSKISLLSMDGKELDISKMKTVSRSEGRVHINLTSSGTLIPGIYCLRITSGRELIARRILIH